MTENPKPGSWDEWKAEHPRWPAHLGRTEWRLEWVVYWCRNLAIFEILEFAGRVSVIVAVILWFWEWGDRTKQSHYRAWELINSARGSSGDGGRIDALQDLNADGVSMTAAPLAKAHLYKVQLPNAMMAAADLSFANLGAANLTGAVLPNANLIGAILATATLNGADLTGAHLNGADLTFAKLSGANLSGADLSQADLTFVDLRGIDLTEVKLENAKFCETTMPDGTKSDRDCPPIPNTTRSAPN